MATLTSPELQHPLLSGGGFQQLPATPLSPPQDYFNRYQYQTPDPQQAPTTPGRPASTLDSRTRFKYFLYRAWFHESLSFFAAFVIFAVLIGLLAAFNGHDLEDAGFYSEVPSSSITFLVTLMRTFMLLPIASGIAQLKWHWFHHQRHPLSDIEVFDDATRGVGGSLRMILKPRFRHFVAVGGLLTVLSMVLETIVNQAVHIRYIGDIVLQDNANVSVPRNNHYEWYLAQRTGEEFGDQAPPAPMISAFEYGLSSRISYDYGGGTELLEPVCPTGNCNFGPYQSLAINSSCANITSWITSDGQNYWIPESSALPDGLPLVIDGGAINATTSFNYPEDRWYPLANQTSGQLGPLIANVYMLGNNQDVGGQFAEECVLYWVVNTYSSTESYTTSYTWNETILASVTNSTITTEYDQTWDIIIEPDDCWVDGQYIENHMSLLDPRDHYPQCLSNVTALAQHGLQNWMRSTTRGFTGELYKGSQGWNETNTFIAYLAQVMIYSGHNNISTNIEQYMFAGLADIMTGTVPQMPRGALALLGQYGSYSLPCKGIMYKEPSFYVRWEVLTFPLLLLFGSVLFTFAVAAGARQHVWKRSNLPLLFHGLGQREREGLRGSLEEYGQMKEQAVNMHVEFQETVEGYKLVE